MHLSLGTSFLSQAHAPTAPATPPVPQVSIFGFTKPVVPPGDWGDFPGRMLTGDQANITDLSVWDDSHSAATVTPGHAVLDGSQPSGTARVGPTTAGNATSGDHVSLLARVVSVSSSGSAHPSLQVNAGYANNNPADHLGWRMGYQLRGSTGPVTGQFIGGAGVGGEITSMEIINMTELLNQKWFIVGAGFAQSNWIGGQTTGYDPEIDRPAPGCVMIPGASMLSYGLRKEVPAPATDPMPHQIAQTGGGPGGAFCRELRRHIPADYTIVYVCASYGGSTKAYWDPAAGNPVAYNNFFSMMRATWSAAPAGSVMGGIIVNQGEVDSGPDFESYGKTVLDEIRAEPGWGEMPIVISEVGGSNAAITASQQKFATGSGDPLEMTRCAFVGRPAGWGLEADGLHFDQPTNRLRGVQVAQGLRDLLYP